MTERQQFRITTETATHHCREFPDTRKSIVGLLPRLISERGFPACVTVVGLRPKMFLSLLLFFLEYKRLGYCRRYESPRRLFP